jgi:hypothetical protein
VVGSTFTSGPLAAAAAAARESNTDQKIAVGRELGLNVTPTQYSMKDCSFTIWVWSWATKTENSRDNARVADAAATAFTTNADTDPEACYRFITDSVYTAHQADVIERVKKVERDRQRVAAAAVVSWNNLVQGDLDSTIKEFVFRVWERAEASSEVKNKAAAVLTPTSTDEQRTAYVVTGIFTARDVDRQRKLEESERAELERRERLANENARAGAWQVVAKAPLTDDLKLITDREFVYELFRRATGKWMKADAQTAVDSRDPAVWKAFIFTGVHAAHQKDLEEQDRQDALETEKLIKEVLDRAVRDGYLPNLASAARTALASDLTARHAFLNVGRYEALKRDQIKPANRRVVELAGIGSGRCLQVAGQGDQPDLPGQFTELWDCVLGPKQVWEMYQVDEGQYMLQNLVSKQCLDVSGDAVVQNDCDDARQNLLWRFVENTADGSFQLQNVLTGRYATAKDGGTANATVLVQSTNTNAIDQRWRIIDPTHRANVVPVESGFAMIKGVESGRCIQVAGWWGEPDEGANADLAEMELWDCVNSSKMRWKIVPLGENKYALENAQSGKCLDVKWGDWRIGTPLVQFGCDYSGSQQFVFVDVGDGHYGLESALTAKFADAVGHATENAAAVKQWEYTGGMNQRWTLVR